MYITVGSVLRLLCDNDTIILSESIYICLFCFFCVCADTEGSFVVERMADIAESAVQHLRGVAETSDDPGSALYIVFGETITNSGVP